MASLVWSTATGIPCPCPSLVALSVVSSGLSVPAKPWSPGLASLRRELHKHTGLWYNFVLVNRYRDGKDKAADFNRNGFRYDLEQFGPRTMTSK